MVTVRAALLPSSSFVSTTIRDLEYRSSCSLVWICSQAQRVSSDHLARYSRVRDCELLSVGHWCDILRWWLRRSAVLAGQWYANLQQCRLHLHIWLDLGSMYFRSCRPRRRPCRRNSACLCARVHERSRNHSSYPDRRKWCRNALRFAYGGLSVIARLILVNSEVLCDIVLHC